jgi:APA family basic amino acid/polyamine antiporter
MRLKNGQISPIGLAALAIGILSPALGLFALWGPMQAAAGPITPLVFLASALLALPTAVSYAQLNVEAPSVGATSTWLWRAVSPSAGYLMGLSMAAYFLFATVSQPLLFGVFLRDLLQLCGVRADGLWVLLLAIPLVSAPVMVSAYRGAEASTRLAVTLMAVESAVVVALSLTIVHARMSAPGGLSLEPFNPAAATKGFAGFWMAMLLGILAFTGFDVVSTAAEETHAPREHIPKAIVLTILGITVFWALNAWIFTLGMPHADVVAASASGDTAVIPLAERFWGAGRILVILTSMTGICAIYISCVLGSSRILFALARHGLLPAPLGRVDSRTGVPRAAIAFVFAAVAVGAPAALLALRNGLAAYIWWSNALVFFASLTYTAVNVANICYFRRIAPERYRPFRNLVVPVIGAVLTLYVMVQTFFVALWNGDFATGRSVVCFCVAAFAAMALVVALVGRRSPGRLSGAAPAEAHPAAEIGGADSF